MIAASARTSGTTLPVSSNLNRGSSASRSAAACAARRRDARTWRLRAAAVAFVVLEAVVAFEAVVVLEAVVVFRTAGLLAVELEAVFRPVVVRVAALDGAGTVTAVIAVRTQISRAVAANRTRITGKPLCDRLLRNVSAL